MLSALVQLTGCDAFGAVRARCFSAAGAVAVATAAGFAPDERGAARAFQCLVERGFVRHVPDDRDFEHPPGPGNNGLYRFTCDDDAGGADAPGQGRGRGPLKDQRSGSAQRLAAGAAARADDVGGAAATAFSSTVARLRPGEADGVAAAIRAALGTAHIKDRAGPDGRVRARCFKGSHAVEVLLLSGLAKSAGHAVAIGNALLAAGAVAHVCGGLGYGRFENDRAALYRCREDAPAAVAAPLLARCGLGDDAAARAWCARWRGACDVADRRYLLTVYPRCVVGRDAVTAAVDRGLAASRAEAVARGRACLALELLAHVTRDHGFKDEGLYYRFADDDEGTAQAAGEAAPTADTDAADVDRDESMRAAAAAMREASTGLLNRTWSQAWSEDGATDGATDGGGDGGGGGEEDDAVGESSGEDDSDIIESSGENDSTLGDDDTDPFADAQALLGDD